MEDCKLGKIDLILCKSISRFSRNLTDCLELVRQLMPIPVHIFFEKENIRTDSMDSELFLTILSAMAESESVSISENNKWAVQHRFMTGTYKQNYAPFGYDSVEDTLAVNPAEAEIVRRIFAETLSGKSAEAVAKALRADGILPRIRNQWGATSVRKILCNEKYKGDALFQKTYTDSLFYRHPNNDQRTK